MAETTEATGSVSILDGDAARAAALGRLLREAWLRVTYHATLADWSAAPAPPSARCLVTELLLPDGSGLAVLESAQAPVIFLTDHGSIRVAVKAMRRGAFDFIERSGSDSDRILSSVQAALRLDAAHREAQAERLATRRLLATLTAREGDVLNHLLAGARTRSMAGALGISPRTVEMHRLRLLRKMRAQDTAALLLAVARAEAGDMLPAHHAAPA